MSHRGPDDEGFVLLNSTNNTSMEFSGPASCAIKQKTLPQLNGGTDFHCIADIGFAHRRYSIIDLSPEGHQPFFSSDQSVCVVFNGEIYNYVELRKKLANKGVVFRTKSDTEVLVESYKHWGEQCFELFVGFWALALYDFTTKQVILSRDRLGKKPLYYYKNNNTVYFASEIKSLLQISSINKQKQINERAAYHWLLFSQKNLFNDSFYKNIMMLPAGTWSIVDKKFPNQTHSFWQIPSQRIQERDLSVQTASDTILNLLQDAVQIRMRADVSACVELSGGMDSSTLVALAAQEKKITTFTVHFQEKQWDEEYYARQVGLLYETDYRVLVNPVYNFWQHILSFTYLQEEPYHAPTLQTNQLIWQKMRDEGIRISLNGAAGDEVFAGYHTYLHGSLLENAVHKDFCVLLKNFLFYTESKNPMQSFYRFSRFLLDRVVTSMDPRLLKHLIRKGKFYNFPQLFSAVSKGYLLSSLLYTDMKQTLLPYWLCSGDRGSMGVPIEIRAPFLDHRLIEFVYQLPVSYLIRDGWHKWILRKAVDSILPPAVTWRKKKMGFPFPLIRFCQENKDIISYIFNNSSAPYINYNYKEQLYTNWQAISYILWYEMFFNENIRLFHEIERMAKEKVSKRYSLHTPAYFNTAKNIFG